ncbi:hypothetical protein ESCO_005634 [Escovopsis weberi]|uniref:Uncharacterized protein n=1 Tax=Escovopsis weberi TaxID=150374 RepID=A0A0M8MUW5_ESCWE|nr:hypothetical protein ESCO_005634 [Escovopsis weberi]
MSSIFNYTFENGRRYHAFRSGQYVLPNDEQEQERLNIHHHLWRLLLGDRLFISPLPAADTNPELFILDLGTGTGIWAMDMADEYLGSTVYGVDLSPIQPEWVPNNCRFFVDDYEDRWTYAEDEKFDFIHGRALGGTSSNWPQFYSQALEHLKPGGWIEMQEYDSWVTSDDDSCERAPWTTAWCRLLQEASGKHGRSNCVSHFHKQWIMDAGFECVEEKVFRIPIGTWGRDPPLKELGSLEQVNVLMAADAQSLALLTRVLHYSEDQARVLIEGVKREFRSPDLRLLTTYRFICGRKPLTSTNAPETPF